MRFPFGSGERPVPSQRFQIRQQIRASCFGRSGAPSNNHGNGGMTESATRDRGA